MIVWGKCAYLHVGEATLVLRQLTRRVGELPESVVRQVGDLSLEVLEELGEALLDFGSMEDLERWLSDYQQQIQQE